MGQEDIINTIFYYDEYYLHVDGTPVVHVDTTGMSEDLNGPICRIYLNDEVIYENPPLPEKDT